MKKNTANEIQNISLSAKQIKTKLEDCLAYDHDKLRNISILFTVKPSQSYKLPFSDFKISISEEMYGQELLLEDIKRHISEIKLLEEKVQVEIEDVEIIVDDEETTYEPIEEPIVTVTEDETNDDVDEDFYEEEIHAIAPSKVEAINDVNIVEEVEEEDYEYIDDEEDEDEDKEFAKSPTGERAKRPKGYTIKVVDVAAIIKKIKEEAIAKNIGKPVMGRRQINKLLKPYMLKQKNDMNIDGIDKTLTSIDIYLNAVNKINTSDLIDEKTSNDLASLDLTSILEDLEKE